MSHQRGSSHTRGSHSRGNSISTPWGERRDNKVDKSATDAWVDVQKSTFQRWANSYLEKKGEGIEDLFADFKTGIKLIKLLEIIGNEKVVKKYNPKPKFKVHCLENLNGAFIYMKDTKGLNLTNISSGDIHDGNQTLILGMMWTIILRFQVADIDFEGLSGKEGLLLWCKKSVAKYKPVYGIEMNNFTRSWADGMAFCALLDRYRPGSLDMDDVASMPPTERMNLAFDLNHELLGVSKLLDADAMQVPDEKSVITYVSQLFSVFASEMQADRDTTSITKAVDITRTHDSWIMDYDRRAGPLVEWLEEKIAAFQQPLVTFS